MNNLMRYDGRVKGGAARVTTGATTTGSITIAGSALATHSITLPFTTAANAGAYVTISGWVSGSTAAVVRHASCAGNTISVVFLNTSTTSITFSGLALRWFVATP